MHEPPPWQAYTQHAAYEGLLRELLLRLKFGRELPLAHHLGALLAGHQHFSGGLGGALVLPIPLHPQRLRARGFNQALELAKGFAARGGHMDESALSRTAYTKSQAGLHFAERQKNLKGIFAAAPRVRGARILLVDDVFTTGATMREAAGTLLTAGAAHIHVAVIARTPSRISMGIPI